ncbi:CoA transferase subunit A [Streptococcus didelphis]|uniref:CoA transferase subunit A n=1 Tax=Streptococcus didelphis TaxID=102886 RepID=A0ABY9LI44_9STRE|nr:CoA transferase subunit A [Streptococcus didelphis]WMB28393.1 CoA transferase subunit A [Streptococcus didelphis]WMB29076.1 CoA transferase subunit A [Streptococcus didelphis]
MLKDKMIPIEEAIGKINDGATIMVGGFMTNGSPEALIDALVKKGSKDLTLICNDAGFIDKGVGKLLKAGQLKKLYATHIGLNREAGRQMNEGELEVELIPQGSFAEKIRIGGFGIGGFYTPTGVGTLVEEGKELKVIDGKTYLLELPFKADFALILANKADQLGNLQYSGSENNFNALMAACAKTTIVQAREVLAKGQLQAECVHTPHIFVDYLIEEGV